MFKFSLLAGSPAMFRSTPMRDGREVFPISAKHDDQMMTDGVGPRRDLHGMHRGR